MVIQTISQAPTRGSLILLTYFDVKLEALILKNVALDSFATALA